jgi:hypothetical protein
LTRRTSIRSIRRGPVRRSKRCNLRHHIQLPHRTPLHGYAHNDRDADGKSDSYGNAEADRHATTNSNPDRDAGHHRYTHCDPGAVSDAVEVRNAANNHLFDPIHNR